MSTTANIAERTAPATDGLLTIATAQRQIGVSRSKLYQLLGAGDLPEPVKIGRRRYFSERELQAWISDRLATRTAVVGPAR
jgi:excisionase family DNA binding protein